MNTIECIETRRSIRKYTTSPIEYDVLIDILKAAVCTPSGKNGQPWKFKIITEKDVLLNISDLSIYGSWMKTAAAMIVVFLDKSKSYNHLKDIQSCNAVTQTILLAAHDFGIGNCWIGEILSASEQAKNAIRCNNSSLKLMGVITPGYAEEQNAKLTKKTLDDFIL
ncbi:MAG: nitroreductase family protein [Clostridiales bacterium]|nr:nitroreductase family protein [Clostridiales bacterium]